MSEDSLTPQSLFEQMPTLFQAEKAGSTNATYQFDLSGDSGGQWWLRVADGVATAGQGSVDTPNVTFAGDAQDYIKIALGTMDPTMAFMQGKLKVKGDMGLAIKMQSMFKRPD